MIRRAEEKDMNDISRLLGQVLLVHHIGRPDLFKEKGAKYSCEELKAIIHDEKSPVFVYEEDGRVIAHCFCQINERKETGAAHACRTLYIDDLCVDENHRGKHIGKSLYEYVRDWAGKNGFYNITLHVWECNPEAKAFYNSLGMGIQQYTMEEILVKRQEPSIT